MAVEYKRFFDCLLIDSNISGSVRANNRVTKIISEHGFDVKRMTKNDIKRMLAIYFEVSVNGDQMPDIEGSEYLEVANV